jgi:hypothetical protein
MVVMKTLAFALPVLFALSMPAAADTVTTEADTLVVVTPNAPVVVQQGGTSVPVVQAPGSTPAMPAAATSAPQNEDWNNVSHINGAPVKVGERGDYLKKFRKTNIMANPFGLFFGYYDVSVSHALSQNVAANVAITGWDFNSGYTQGYQLSATLPLYFRRTYSGPFLEGGLLIRTDIDNYGYYSGCAECGSDSDTWVGPELLFGWHWTFDSGLNLALAFGVAKQLGNTRSDEYDYDNGPEANGYFRVGYAF